MKLAPLLALAALAGLLPAAALAQARPNVVLVMADDMGFSDIGSFGGEIDTPNLDKLAANGVKFTQFYNTARCCPTRASLLTGLHPAQTGVGHMTNPPEARDAHDYRVDGYRGQLNADNATLAEVARSAGYATLMAGKWHLGFFDQSTWPVQRGFDRYYGIITGGANYFRPSGDRGLTLGNDPVEPVSTTDGRYYTTDAFTDYAIQFVEENPRDKPFFLYLAYNAPHWPLQAPEDLIAKYRGRYKRDWQQFRRERFARQRASGLFDGSVTLSEQDSLDWNSLSAAEQDEMDLRMAIYAAQVERMDAGIGKLVDKLEALGELDDTLILFLTDNGGCAEGGMLGGGEVVDVEKRNNGFLVSYGQAWANVSDTPFRKYKHYTHEGGIATPLIAHWPAGIAARGEWRRQPGYLPDVMATLVELTGAAYPTERDGHPVPPMEGTSLVPALADKSLERGKPMFWEHEGNRAARDGDWKLVSTGPLQTYGGEESWELYDLANDRSETKDVIEEHPDVAARLKEAWWEWARTHGVVPNGKGATAKQ